MDNILSEDLRFGARWLDNRVPILHLVVPG